MLTMDFFAYSPLFGLLILAPFLISISFFLRNKSSSSSSSSSSSILPPGSKGWPIVGESLPFLYTMLKNTPAKFIFDRISRNSSHVFQTHILGENCAVMCGAASNKFLFSNENKLVRVWFPTTFDKLFPLSELTSGIDHGRLKLRRIITQLLKPANLQHYIGMMDEICEKHFSSKWENKDEVNVYDLAKDYTFSFACKLFFSVEDTHFEEKLAKPFAIFSSGLLAMPLDVPGTPFRRSIKASKLIRKEIEVIIKQRKVDLANGNVSPTQDILSQVLSTSDENGEFMDEKDVVNMLLGLLIGGYDTVSSTCTFIVKYLAELPHIYGQVYKEQMEIANSKKEGELLNWNDINKRMRYSWNVACEVLRLDPPSPAGAFREALTDFKIDDFLIPKGWKIYWSVHSTHRDPKYFKEPEKFDPSRFEGGRPAPYTYVPFGGGRRMCPGNEFARLGILIYMHHLVRRFSWKNISPNKAYSFVDLLFPAKEKLIVQLSQQTGNIL